MNSPLVSFIIPYFNAGAAIHETIESVFNQSYSNFDIWIINDGSTDPFSIEILKNFDDNIKIHILHQENAGIVGGSRNLLFFFTCEVSKLKFKSLSTFHKDMTLLNLVIHENFYPKLSMYNWNQKLVDNSNDLIATHQNLVTSFPLNRGFNDLDLNSKAFFIHK